MVIKKYKWLIAFFAVFLLSFLIDKQIFQLIILIQNSLLDKFFLALTFITSSIIIFFFLTTLFLWKEHKRRWIIPLWLTIFFSAAISFILKISVHRLRPFQQDLVQLLPVLVEHGHSIWDFSFPSFHAMLVFSTLPILKKEFKNIYLFWVLIAILISFSRIYFGLHFLTDILFGGIVGYIIGVLIIELEQKTKICKKIYKKILGKK